MKSTHVPTRTKRDTCGLPHRSRRAYLFLPVLPWLVAALISTTGAADGRLQTEASIKPLEQAVTRTPSQGAAQKESLLPEPVAQPLIGTLGEPQTQSSGHFVQQRDVQGLPMPLDSRGVFYQHQDHGFIWSMVDPIGETLVLRLDGRLFRVSTNSVEELKRGPARQLTETIHALMRGDAKRLRKQFRLAQPSDTELTLVPRSRRLRRAISELRVKTVLSERGDSATSFPRRELTLLDATGLETRITVHETVRAGQPTAACGLVPDLTDGLCALLLADSPNLKGP